MGVNSSLINDVQKLLPANLYEDNQRVAKFEARLIAEKITGKNYSQLVTQNIELDELQVSEITRIVKLRSTGMPLAYILKEAYFRDLEIFVDERVLIPRSETELLVDKVLNSITKIENPKILEVGVGSGAISLSISHERSDAAVIGVDLSQGAVDVANLNKAKFGFVGKNVQFLQGNIFDSLSAKFYNYFDVIVSNPPYIGEDEKQSLSPQVLDYEPHMALFADELGFEIYRKILDGSKKWLKASGVVLFEISPRHKDSLFAQANELGFSEVNFYNDLTGTTRIAQIII